MEGNTEKLVDKLKVPYIVIRIITLLSVALFFFPSLSPTNFITKAGSAPIKATSSFFASGFSYSSLTHNMGRAFTKGWLNETHFKLIMLLSLLALIGVALMAVGSCLSLGNLKMKNFGNSFILGGAISEFVGVLGVFVIYNIIKSTSDPKRVTTQFPIGAVIFILAALIAIIAAIIIMKKSPKADVNDKMDMQTKYKLFLMLMPFLFLVFAFSYLPLFSWRYAFFDYESGQTLTMENFVGFKWFKTLVKDTVYIKKLLTVLRNTLVMSALGILTSWVPMFFAIFLSEIKSTRFKRFVQVFSTVPNFISWVLVYAIAYAIFYSDGFINTLINSVGGSANTNYLQSADFIWLKMLLWGMWKGVGWSAIIYISGIAGIDQQLYEAATVDGAGRFQKMRYITLPGLLPTYVVMLVMSIAGILSNGMDQYLVFTNSENKYMLEVLDLYVYKLGIGEGIIPLSTVVGMTKSIISVALLFVANKVSKMIRGENVV